MRRKDFAIFLFCCSAVFSSFAGPGLYYNAVDTNKTCASLKTALFHLISFNTMVIPYGSVDNYYNITDSKPAEGDTGMVIEERYSEDIPNGQDSCNFRYPDDFCGGRSSNVQCYCYNKEHVFPSSWFGGQNVSPMGSDMHYIWPADTKVNITKSNFPIGYVQTASFVSNNGTKIGTSNSSLNYGFASSNVFEPIDSFKGDFARAYLYVITRYEDSIPFWIARSTANNALDGLKYPGFDAWMLQLCVKWNKLDPPSTFERKRNDAVYALQGNRNPYIDYPNWVEKVFGVNGISGSCVSTGIINKTKEVEFSIFPNPAKNILYLKLEKTIAADGVLEILDVTGRKIHEQKIEAGQNQSSVDITTLAKGTYFLDILYNGSPSVSTFIKE